MKGKEILDKLANTRGLRRLKTIFETLQGIIYGSTEVTDRGPHIRDNMEIKRFMSCVILGLMPTTVASILFYGWHAVLMIVVAYVSGGLVEVIFAIVRRKDIEEGFFVTGLIFPLVLPPTVPLWVVVVGMAFGVFFGKEIFGGTGRNIFNPALVGRLFITIAFPKIMSATWQAPFADAVTSATPLVVYKNSQTAASFIDLVLGQTAGSMGELFRLGIIAGGVFLIIARVSNWRVPLSYLGSVLLFSFLGYLLSPSDIAPPLFQLLSGGLLFGAMFMATDPVTSPATNLGKYIFGVLCGLLTVLIRSFSGYTEGVMFSIILANAVTPLLDHVILEYKYRTVER